MARSRESAAARMNFSANSKDYVLGDEPDDVGVHKAKHVNPTTGEEVPVGIKIVDVNKMKEVYSILSELYRAEAYDHENILKAHRSFMADKNRLWIIMPPVGTPIGSVIRSSFRGGLPADAVGVILKKTLRALHYMHERGEVHRSVGVGCVFLDDECRVKIGMSSITGGAGTAVDPELEAYYGETKLDKATDVLMFGFLALELFYGEIPSCSEVRSLVANQRRRKSRGLSCFGAEANRIPTALAEVMAACLCRDRSARPTADQLMKFRLFRKSFFWNPNSQKVIKKLFIN